MLRIAFMILSIFLLCSPHISASSFSAELEQFLKEEPSLDGALIGISVRSAKTGELLFENNGDTRLRPASNLKLITAAAALAKLGEDYTFRTELATDGKLKGRTLKGNLYIVGKGDPTLQSADFDTLAKKIKRLGIETIEGDIIGDDTWYDDVRLSQDLIWSDEQHYYGGQISALTASPNNEFDTGSVILEVKPGQSAGEGAVIRAIPANKYVKIINRVSTVTPDSASNIQFLRLHGTNTIAIEGVIPIGSSGKREYIAVWEPTGYALYLFKQSLEKQGIKIGGRINTGKWSDGQVLVTHHSLPLSKLLVPFLKLSNNVHAEVLVKEMGKVLHGEGSWEKGLAVVGEQMGLYGIVREALFLRDGSGLSHLNLVTSNALTQLLFQVQKEPWFDTFHHALPVAGGKGKLESGTLRKRLATINVRAKTGTLTTVTSLSGYLQTKSGEPLIFSILVNHIYDEGEGKKIEDKIVEILSNQR